MTDEATGLNHPTITNWWNQGLSILETVDAEIIETKVRLHDLTATRRKIARVFATPKTAKRAYTKHTAKGA